MDVLRPETFIKKGGGGGTLWDHGHEECSVVQVVLRWTDKTRVVSIISFLLYTLELVWL